MYSVSAMLDEFLKISAAQVNPEVRKQKIIAGAKGYGTTTAAGLAGMAGSKGLEHVMLRQQAKAGPASKRQLGELYRSMGAKRVKITRAPVGEHFNPATRTISLRPRTSAAVAAHELGGTPRVGTCHLRRMESVKGLSMVGLQCWRTYFWIRSPEQRKPCLGWERPVACRCSQKKVVPLGEL